MCVELLWLRVSGRVYLIWKQEQRQKSLRGARCKTRGGLAGNAPFSRVKMTGCDRRMFLSQLGATARISFFETPGSSCPWERSEIER